MHFLENERVTIGGVSFIGATLWTDFRVEGGHEMAMAYARERMNDYRQIALQRNPWKRLVPNATFRMHQDSRRCIAMALAANTMPAVVVTHHLPHPLSIAPRFRGDRLNAAYAWDLSEVIQAGRPALWVHGHTHDSFDYRIYDTRVAYNPRGYADENREFDARLVVHL